MARKLNTTYFLIRNANGKYLYNDYASKGFASTPRYINLKSAKKRIIDVVELAEFEVGSDYIKDIINDLVGVTITVYDFDTTSGEMLRDCSTPPINIIEFFIAYNMPEYVSKLKDLTLKACTLLTSK